MPPSVSTTHPLCGWQKIENEHRKCYLKLHSGTYKFAFDRRDLNCIRRQGALNNYSLLLCWFAAWTCTYHTPQQRGSSSARGARAVCILTGGLAEQTAEGPNAPENQEDCRFHGQIGAVWILSHLSEKNLPVNQTGFPAECLEESGFCCVTVQKLWNDSDPREKHISCSSWFGKTLHTPSPLAAGAGPKTLILHQLHLLCCMRRLQWEYSYQSKFNIWYFFSPI